MARRTLNQFKKDHPFCCFCGGDEPTQSRDEVPPKAMFVGRIWPENYQFPACNACNSSSRLEDQALALFARLSFLDAHSSAESVSPFAKGVQNNSPEVYPLTPDAGEEYAKIVEGIDFALPKGVSEDQVGVAFISADAMQRIDRVLQKMFCALYYLHTGKILPNKSTLMVLRTTNQILADDDPYDWLNIPGTDIKPVVARGGKSLSDQFDYRWGFNTSEGLFSLSFHLRFSIFGIMIGPLPEHVKVTMEQESLVVTGRST